MQRVGWIRIGALGDLLVGLASLRETLDRWPKAKITVVGSPLWLQIIEPGVWPQIDRIAVVEKRGTDAKIYELKGSAESLRWTALDGESRSLRREFTNGYDVVFNARVDSPRQGFAAFWARVPERWGSAEGFAEFIYNRRAPHDGKDPLIHERDVPLLLMDEAEPKLGSDPRFFGKSLNERIEASPRIRKWREAGLPCPRRFDSSEIKKSIGSERYLIINPTSSRREKAWPTASFRELLLRLSENDSIRHVLPIIVGAPTETEWLREVAIDKHRIFQAKTIGELFDVVSGAELLVTNTSSMQFIAASVGTKTLTLMGRARREIWGPLGPSDRFVLGTEPAGVESMFERELKAYESISVKTVLEAVLSFNGFS